MLLGKAPAAAQGTDQPAWRTVAFTRASVTTVWIEENDGALAELARSEFVGMLERHGSLVRYSEAPAAGLKLSHYTAGLKLDLPALFRESPLRLYADLGLGATRIRSSRLYYREADPVISKTYLSFRGGVTVEYNVAPRFQIVVAGRELLYLDDHDRLVFEKLGGESKILESGSWAFPLTFGLRLGID